MEKRLVEVSKDCKSEGQNPFNQYRYFGNLLFQTGAIMYLKCKAFPNWLPQSTTQYIDN